jgi:hypothetical protein
LPVTFQACQSRGPIVGRCIAGLAEAIQIRLRELDDIEHLRTSVAHLAQTVSAVGQVAAD